MGLPKTKIEEGYQKPTSRISGLTKVIPGSLYCLSIMLISTVMAKWLGQWINQLQGLPINSSSPISSIFIAIILGLLIRNIIGLQEIFKDGVVFSIKFILKFGIILLGIRLSFIDVIKLATWGIPIILASVIAGLLVTLWFTNKMKQSHRLGTLVACGTGICGITAIVAISPSIKANDEEVAYAIANITIFGIIAMFAYPYLAHYLFQDDPIRAGLFLGTSIHDTAQVAGAALIYGQVFDTAKVVDVATITKLTRNVLIVAVVPILSYYYFKKVADSSVTGTQPTKKWYKLIPLFVLGFLAMAVVRTIGDAGVENNSAAFGILNPDQWIETWSTINSIGSNYLLGIAMAAVGLSTSFKVFKGLGFKPFLIGMVAAISVGIISLVMVSLLGGFITI
ncbi:YeiH family protein [Alkalihalobacillus deserti]|uniref:YeiH family protein n=1 Tax=Alkalihalobacillus deserti TaxID=2879466 RepID=UPI001D152FAA|nr:putative sulfate exporter family transporter [Alkalihalobacillus deserti]